MSYDGLLPEAQWINLVAEQGLRTSPPTATAARLWLIEQLSGAPVRIKEDELQCRGVCTDRMRTTLTPQLVDKLDTIAGHFLQTHGAAGEPPTWSPPLSLLVGLDLPGTPPETVDPNVVHDLVSPGPRFLPSPDNSMPRCGRSDTSSNTNPSALRHRCDRRDRTDAAAAAPAARPPVYARCSLRTPCAACS